jgi:hypothetical protein
VYPSDSEGLHKLACYLMRAPVNLSRLRYHPDSQLLLYEPKGGQAIEDDDPLVDPLEFLARVLIHIPEPKRHLVLFYGAYANRIRTLYRADDSARFQADGEANELTFRRTLSRRWAELIYRVYVIDPLDCPRCEASMKILAFITQPAVIHQILDRLDAKTRQRAPPESSNGPWSI